MEKPEERQEYESAKIASTFWWDTALLTIVLTIVITLVLAIPLAMLVLMLGSILGNLVSIALGIGITLLSEIIAIKKVKKRAIVKADQVPEIVNLFGKKFIILIVVLAVLNIVLKSFSVVSLISWILQAVVATWYANKLLIGLAE